MTEETKAIVSIPFNVEEMEPPFGKRWGQQTVELTPDDLLALFSQERVRAYCVK
ncbi:MAG TPA: hypothetical protein VHY08_23445 [Bacillota bacterium]|nr:hypothetical protein [Bacillota bacterium]